MYILNSIYGMLQNTVHIIYMYMNISSVFNILDNDDLGVASEFDSICINYFYLDGRDYNDSDTSSESGSEEGESLL